MEGNLIGFIVLGFIGWMTLNYILDILSQMCSFLFDSELTKGKCILLTLVQLKPQQSEQNSVNFFFICIFFTLMNVSTCFHTSHHNGVVRKVCSKSLADLAEKIGPSRLLTSCKDILSRAGKLAVDSQPDARYHGRRILYLLLDHPELDKLLAKSLTTANLRPVHDIVDNLRNKVNCIGLRVSLSIVVIRPVVFYCKREFSYGYTDSIQFAAK